MIKISLKIEFHVILRISFNFTINMETKIKQQQQQANDKKKKKNLKHIPKYFEITNANKIAQK